jgi:exodeoxyribonuclease VII large subunit
MVACDIPIISGIGHEVDTTIADYAADHRAATPSAAAELASPSQLSYLHKFQSYQRNLIRLMKNQLKYTNEQTQWLKNRLKNQHPRSQLSQQSQQLDDLTESLQSAFESIIRHKQHQFKYALQGLINNRPDQFIDYQKIQLDDLTSRLVYMSQQSVAHKRQQLANLSRTLQAVSPLNTLSRGYSITRNSKGQTINNANQLKDGDVIETQLQHGKIKSRVI